MSITHTFKLTSNVECEVSEMTGYHQEILTTASSKNPYDRSDELVHALLVRVGSLTGKDLSLDFVKKMLASDKRHVLAEARQFSMDFPETFHFVHEGVNSLGELRKTEIDVPIPDGRFAYKKLHVVNPDTGALEPASYTEYDQIARFQEFTLSDGRVVRWSLLDGQGERVLAAMSANFNSSTLLKARRPTVFVEDSNGDPVGVSLDTSKLSMRNIEALRKAVVDTEGDVYTQVAFNGFREESPVAVPMKIDVMQTQDFFFPSGAI